MPQFLVLFPNLQPGQLTSKPEFLQRINILSPRAVEEQGVDPVVQSRKGSCGCCVCLVAKSCLTLFFFLKSWTVAFQVPLSMGLSRQEYWSGLPFPSPGDLPDPGSNRRFFTTETPGRVQKALVASQMASTHFLGLTALLQPSISEVSGTASSQVF